MVRVHLGIIFVSVTEINKPFLFLVSEIMDTTFKSKLCFFSLFKSKKKCFNRKQNLKKPAFLKSSFSCQFWHHFTIRCNVDDFSNCIYHCFTVFNCSNRDKEDDSPVVEQFIARKADLLFAPAWKSTTPGEDKLQEETQGYLCTVQIHNHSCKTLSP